LDKGIDFPVDNGLFRSVVVELINAHTVLVGNIPKEAASPKSSIFLGIGDCGQRCLLAKRLVQSGVRFVEVSHNLNFIYVTEWDTNKQGQLIQHGLIRELDNALASQPKIWKLIIC
jgi:hypothetical protein